MATLRKRGKTYTAYIVRQIPNTKIRKTIATFNFGAVSKTEAEDRLSKINKAEYRILIGSITEKDYPTWFYWLNDSGKEQEYAAERNLGETIKEFLDFKKFSIRSSSYNRVRVSMDRLLEVIKPKTTLKSIKTKNITEYKNHFSSKHRPAGMNVNLTNIRTFFRWCYDEEYMDRIPKIVIHKPAKEDKYLSEKKIEKVLDSCSSLYRKVFKVYLETGKRRSELIEGSLKGNLLIIPVHDDLKSKKAHSIKLSAEQVDTIRQLHRDRDEYLTKGYLLRSYKDRFSNEMTKVLKKLGLYEKWNTKLHSLRHSAGIIKYLESDDLKAVKKKLNHSSLEMSDYYSEIDMNIIEDDFKNAYEVRKLAKNLKTDILCRQNESLN